MESLIHKIEKYKNHDDSKIQSIISKVLYQNFFSGNFLTIKELAEECNVSESTITVYSKNLGYSGYRELLILLKMENNFYNKTFQSEIGAKSDKQKINKYREILNEFLNEQKKEDEKIIKLVANMKKANKIVINSSYQLDDIANYFKDLLSLKFDNVLKNELKLFAYKNAQNLTEKDLAIFFVSGQDNEMMQYIFAVTKKMTKNIFIFSSRSQIEKFDMQENVIILDVPKLGSDHTYRRIILDNYVSIISLLL
ncbi:putative transcriptional regulator [Mesoplasma florum L1]|uniref:Transcriptional regulator n=1 Tax=Mesoplasma florum (strain ATCC 33453 / NBRC 100688 / NCTC 11704 / L1) TaxID=265311 RepID=Q6F1F5_MESFL|nr:MurR/RpiR family transcriptional regulator [Mesoplasma florum]AAT75668.1 putative transcriptional regulator [Mesoplasma florum L1]